MGSNVNFKNMGEAPPEGSGVIRPPGGFPLARQTSVYSLTFDEFQNTMGGLGKDFGSMNMDEFLRNIWTAEEAQAMGMIPSAFGAGAAGGSGSGAPVEGGLPNGNLQRQGSLTLPRTLSTKTVDQVWKDLYKENGGVLKDGSLDVNLNDGVAVGSNMQQQRQQTLGEMTLEEFLVRAGVVREEPQTVGRPSNTTNNNGFYGEMFGANNNNNNGGLALGFGQQTNRPNAIAVNRVNDNNNLLVNQSPNLDMTMNGNRSSQQQQLQQQPLPQPQHQHILPKQPAVSYASPLHLTNNGHLGSPGIRGGVGGLGDTMMTNGFVQNGGLNMVGLGGAGTAVTIASTSPANRPSSDGLGKSNGDNSSLSPVPYVFNGTLRGKRSGAVEKVVERRQRRMIKNRESAARSRARKQAYTMELEAEVAKLKEENQELQKKQAEILEMQKNQESEMTNQQPRSKRPCLRRTQTGPW
ncbi:hypothetical protein MKW94_000789 [Papaver nudicaule]|uniref:BZIP domain-containing protein n=1 Tax=Papaver nudicaule TaxID=74823 RepID=A0AA41VP70_PAPNU|nr:hypothetical protein [Papaver nudicaule]